MLPETTSATTRLADGILVVNLDHRGERLERIAEQAAKHPVLATWQRLPAVSGVEIAGFGEAPWFRGRKRDRAWAGRAGCTLSHRKAIQHAKSAGWKSVLILEDDMLPADDFSEEVAALLGDSQEIPGDWDALYLGCSIPVGPCMLDTRLQGRRSLHRIFGSSGTFAYILKDTTYERLLRELPDESTIWPWLFIHRAIDRWYARNLSRHFRVAAIQPNLIGHYSSFSDITLRAGVEIPLCDEESEALVPPRPSPGWVFKILSVLLHRRFQLAGLCQWLRLPLVKRRGFG